MGKITVAGIQDVKADENLVNSRYTIECVGQKIVEKSGSDKISLALNYRIVAGVTQPDGASPEDRRLSDFFPLNGYEDMKDGGKFVKGKLRGALDAFGVTVNDDGSFDPEEFLLKRADALTRNTENKQLGITETQINRYVKTA